MQEKSCIQLQNFGGGVAFPVHNLLQDLFALPYSDVIFLSLNFLKTLQLADFLKNYVTTFFDCRYYQPYAIISKQATSKHLTLRDPKTVML